MGKRLVACFLSLFLLVSCTAPTSYSPPVEKNSYKRDIKQWNDRFGKDPEAVRTYQQDKQHLERYLDKHPEKAKKYKCDIEQGHKPFGGALETEGK